MAWNYFTLRSYPVKDAPCHFASWRESQPMDAMDKMLMLQRCKLEIECMDHNIEEALKLPDILKPDGYIHKTNMNKRKQIIKKMEKERKLFQEWFDEYKKKNKKLLYISEDFRKTWMHSSQFVLKDS